MNTPTPLPKKKPAAFHHPLGFELYDDLAMDLHAMTYAEPLLKEIERLQALYDAQCGCTDEWAEKYRAEVERKADATLLARVAELEQALASVNARLAVAQDAMGAVR